MSRKTKIIATLGPAVASLEDITELIEAGMNVARLNFSHGTHDSHRQYHRWVRQASEQLGVPVAILQDIQGPRIRVGSFPGGSVVLETGSDVVLVPGEGEGSAREVYVENLEAAALTDGSTVLLSDGLIAMDVLFADGGIVKCRVTEGGVLRDHKGVAFPGIQIATPAVTDKDREDLEFGAELGMDYVAASFVTSGAGVREVKRLTDGVPVISKIESIVGYGNLGEIVEESAGVMVARGDLGVELSFESVPRAQKQIISFANSKARISITATEMLESMTSSPRPTRAEVTDVSSAVLDGSDAVMLSAETAIGKYPVRTVSAMARICVEAEASPSYSRGEEIHFLESAARFASATAQACVDAADNLDLAAIVAFTESGSTPLLISKYRPNASIFAYTPIEETYRRMAMYSGVTPLQFGRVESTDEMISYAEQSLVDLGIVKPGDSVVMAAGIPPNRSASTNLMKLHLVGSQTSGIPGTGE
ncbi:MAG: pyruvate kinase [Acidimicrobiia bacterium]|nr:pyruvate kinase [Acidimicrobiia bacterium]